MATLHSFYLPPDAWHEPFTLAGSEAHHLDRVLRLKVGYTIRLFDGQGRHGTFSITSKDKRTVTLSPLELHTAQPASHRITLAAGYSKALRRSWFIEKAVELEAHALLFWQGDFSQATIPDKEKDTWQSTIINAAKQCENPWLPEIGVIPNGIEELTAEVPRFTKTLCLYEGNTNGALLSHADLATPGDTLLIIGPEGGFSPREIHHIHETGIPTVSLGNSTLRWETAAIVALGIAWWAHQ